MHAVNEAEVRVADHSEDLIEGAERESRWREAVVDGWVRDGHRLLFYVVSEGRWGGAAVKVAVICPGKSAMAPCSFGGASYCAVQTDLDQVGSRDFLEQQTEDWVGVAPINGSLTIEWQGRGEDGLFWRPIREAVHYL